MRTKRAMSEGLALCFGMAVAAAMLIVKLMATGMAVAERNSALDATFTGTQWIQLHTADPGAAGTTAVATNSTRKSTTWNAASAGAKTNAGDLLWSSVSTTETYTHFSVWTASSAGTFKGSGTISGGGVTAGQDFDVAIAALSLTLAGA